MRLLNILFFYIFNAKNVLKSKKDEPKSVFSFTACRNDEVLIY